jgi:flavin-dependent dehydrogenase
MTDRHAEILDVVVIGGGPSGGLLASLVRRQNPERSVLVLEKETFPRHHVGESTIPSWRPILDRAGLLERLEGQGFMRKVGTLFQWGTADDERWTIDFRDESTGGARPGSYQVDRSAFDRAVLEHARALGAQVLEGATVRTAERVDGGFLVKWERDGRRASVRARYLVDASGQARVLSRLWGLRLVPFDDMNNYAVYGYWKGSGIAQFAGPPAHEHERWTYISTCAEGWAWHIPTFPDLVSVGIVTDADAIPVGGPNALEDFYLRNVRGAEGLAELLAQAELAQHPLAHTRLLTIRDWAYHVADVCGPGWFLVGDAAAFVDPILSSGMLIAANGASLAANALNTLWSDSSVDLPLLLKSYQSTYDNMAESYHRMARVWYTRNFKYSTWHWEAKRQRLRAGGHPAGESDAAAFMQLCIGSFVDPVEGLFTERGAFSDFLRPDARIYAAHLFRGDPSLEGIGGNHADEEAARRRIEAETRRRWITLLASRVAARGFTTRVVESYFTDGTMDRWQRARYLELRPSPATDDFDRVVFPITREMPEGVAPHLAHARMLCDILSGLGAALLVGSIAYQTFLSTVQQQILQLDLRGWLDVVEPEGVPVEPTWPTPILAVLDRVPGVRADVDLLGGSIALSLSSPNVRDHAAVTLMPVTRADPAFVWKTTKTTALSYRGDFALVGPVASGLLRVLRAWETADPGGASTLWLQDIPRLAGRSLGP